MEDQKSFWNRKATGYFENPISNPEIYEEKLSRTHELMRTDMQVLEFGCGTGGTALRHAPHVDQVHIVDVSDAMLEIAQKQVKDADVDNISFECADIEKFDARNESYDMVLGMSIIHLLENPKEVISNVHRWLKPGGYFISSTVCVGDKMGWIRYLIPLGRAIRLMPHLSVLTTAQLMQDLLEVGFEMTHHWKPEDNMGTFLICRKPV